MTQEEMWAASGLAGDYDAWQFGGEPDALADLVLRGAKTATASVYCLYERDGEPLPRAGELSVVLNSRGEGVCIIRTTGVTVVPFRRVTAEHAFREGEGDRSLAHWRQVHRDFFAGELAEAGLPFDEDLLVVCEEFERVYPEQP